MDTIHLGFIGFGAWARIAYAPIINELPGVKAAAVSVRHEKTYLAAKAALQDDPIWYGDFQQLLDDEQIDAVVIAVPNALHDQVIDAALNSSKHILFEPPIAASRPRAMALLDKAKRSGRVVQCDLELRCLPVVRLMQEKIDAGAVGEVMCAKVSLIADWARNSSDDWPDDLAEQGFSVWLGCWYLDLLDVVFTCRHSSVDFFGGGGPGAMVGGIASYAQIILRYPQQRLGLLEYNLMAVEGLEVQMHIIASQGEMRVDLIEGVCRWRCTDQPQWREAAAPASTPVHGFVGMRESMGGFIDAIRKGNSPAADLPAIGRIHEAAFDSLASESSAC